MSKTANPEQTEPVPMWRDACLLEVRGPDSIDFLQGYLTCDTQRVNTATATPMAICNVKGRVLANGWAIGLAEGTGLIVHSSLGSVVEQFLKPYINFSKCSLANSGNTRLSLSETLPGIELVAGFYLSVLQAEPAVTVDVSADINDSLVAAGFAFIAAPVAEKFLPQMLALDQHGAVDFNKGCYLGQEIVARAEFRGAVKRKLVQFSWQDTAAQIAPEIGTIWQTMGTVINVSSDGHGLVLAKTNPA